MLFRFFLNVAKQEKTGHFSFIAGLCIFMLQHGVKPFLTNVKALTFYNRSWLLM